MASTTDTPYKHRWISIAALGHLIAVLAVALFWSRGPSDTGPQAPPPQKMPATQVTVAPGSAGPRGKIPVFFLRAAPDILPGQPAPHRYRGRCASCHSYLKTTSAPPSSLATADTGGQGALVVAVRQAGSRLSTRATPGAASGNLPLSMLPFQEAHWQGLEVVPMTSGLARLLKVQRGTRGVVVDEATSPADAAGFMAGDVITAVARTPTPDLESFIQASEKVRDLRRVTIRLVRRESPRRLKLVAARTRLGVANGEAAPMIKAGSRAPHGYKGPCTSCHHVGTTGQLAVDPGDLLTSIAPTISRGQSPPHRDRGKCSSCHLIR